MAKILLDAGRDTEDLVSFITGEVSEDLLDEMSVERTGLKSEKLATEPLTVSATLTLSAAAIVTIGRIIEKWLEHRNQRAQLIIVAAGFSVSDEAGKALASVATKYADVAISFGMPGPHGQAEGE